MEMRLGVERVMPWRCDLCAERLRDFLAGSAGVERVGLEEGVLSIAYRPGIASQASMEAMARAFAAELGAKYRHDAITISGMDCADCAATVQKAVARMEGVSWAALNFTTSKLEIEYSPEKVSLEEVSEEVEGLGYKVQEAGGLVASHFIVSGMDCSHDEEGIERKVASIPKVAKARVSFVTSRMTVSHEPGVQADALMAAVRELGYEVRRAVEGEEAGVPFWERHKKDLLTAVSGLLLMAGAALSLSGAQWPLVRGVYAAAIVIGGAYVARNGLYTLLNFHTLNINFLVTIAAVGAAAIGDWFEGATVIFLFSLANALEDYTMDRTRNAIRYLMELTPTEAIVRRDGRELTVPVKEVKVGEIVLVKPGEKIPMDGVVAAGSSTVNQAPITGESMAVEKEVGDNVYASTINRQGALEVRVTKLYQETTLAKIIHMVEQAQGKRAPSQQFVDRFTEYYTPAVILIAVGIATVPYLIFGEPFVPWFYKALVLLVISCPCPLVISTPVSIVSAIGGAARNGVLIKGGAYLEEMGQVSVVAFDKTGTLTKGVARVTEIIPMACNSTEEVLALAAAVEGLSEHPLAAAVVQRARKEEIAPKRVEDFQAIPGKGAKGRVDGQVYYVGNTRLFEELQIPISAAAEKIERLQGEGQTVVLVGTEGRVLGMIAVGDQVRESSREAVRGLYAAGIKKVVMVTGDNRATAKAIAAQLGVEDYRAELLPQEKVEVIKELMREHKKVAMVGDGVNDAPALASATVGIAMGAAGSDVALETADIALMADDVSKVPYAIELGKRSIRIIKQNIVISVVTKLAFVIGVIPGLVTLWMAVLADMGIALLVTLNGMRLARK